MATATSDDAEALRRIREMCLRFEGADESELQNRPLFRVGNRRFAIFNGLEARPRPRWNASGRSLHFLADPIELQALRDDPRFGTSPHHGDKGWLALSLGDLAAVDWQEVHELLEAAYLRVSRRSPREE